MKTKILSLIMVIIMLCCLSACGSTNSSKSSTEPADLTGEWKQVNSNSEDSWQAATIDGETITIYWVSDGGDTKSLYWAGTYVAPTTTDEPYSWDSENDHSQTDSALLASGDDTKTITYENGQISYSASALGTTTTVRLEKQE
jgi:ABC-type glycerol-3-phosphate transport system substrate-binding protein